MSNRVIIFDTTLRDGEQSPGATMNLQEKLRMARQLESLGVDVIEAGFPASSVGDFEAVHAIANAVTDVQVAALARCNKNDIDRAWQALNGARNPRIHVFLATSPIHMEYKLRKTPDQVVEMAVAAVRHAAKYTNNVEFSAEDASRSNPDFLVRVFTEVINAGATTINVPDTVGYAKIYGIHQALAPSWFPDQLWPRKHRRIGILGQPGMKMIVSEKGTNYEKNWGYNDFMTWRVRWTNDTGTYQGSSLSYLYPLNRDLPEGSTGGWEGPRSIRYRHNNKNSGLFGDGHAALNARGVLNWKDNILIDALNQASENYYGF